MANIVDQTVLRQNTRREPPLYVAMEHVESWTGQVRVPLGSGVGEASDAQVLKRFRADDVLFGKLRPYLAKVTRLDRGGVCVGEFLVLRARHKGVLAAYMEYLLRSKPIIDTVNSSTFGAKMPRADWQFVAGLRVPRPPIKDQRCIAGFLDHETAKIDALVAKQRELIRLLQEKRTALISHAVTKGLDPDVTRKESGVEWLGEIPAHWEVKRLGYITKCLDGQRIPLNAEQRGRMQGEYPYWGANSIVDYVDSWLFDEELVLLGEDGAPFFDADRPVAFHVSGRIWVNNHAHVLRPAAIVCAAFLTSALNCVDYSWYIAGATRDKLTQSDMGSIPIQLPPAQEQHAISTYLEAETRKLDRLVSKAHQAIGALDEYRSALISAAVTGKIDVRRAREPNATPPTATPHPTP